VNNRSNINIYRSSHRTRRNDVESVGRKDRATRFTRGFAVGGTLNLFTGKYHEVKDVFYFFIFFSCRTTVFRVSNSREMSSFFSFFFFHFPRRGKRERPASGASATGPDGVLVVRPAVRWRCATRVSDGVRFAPSRFRRPCQSTVGRRLDYARLVRARACVSFGACFVCFFFHVRLSRSLRTTFVSKPLRRSRPRVSYQPIGRRPARRRANSLSEDRSFFAETSVITRVSFPMRVVYRPRSSSRRDRRRGKRLVGAVGVDQVPAAGMR